MQFGLENIIIEKINSVFVVYNQIESVIIYGSRANNSNKPNSDIDLTIKSSELTFFGTFTNRK
jgi:predicted nucleotidyltransferase